MRRNDMAVPRTKINTMSGRRRRQVRRLEDDISAYAEEGVYACLDFCRPRDRLTAVYASMTTKLSVTHSENIYELLQ